MIRKLLIAAGVAAILLSGGKAMAAGPLIVDGRAVDAAGSCVYQNTTYVPLRTVTEALRPDVEVTWENDHAVVCAPGLELTAQPGETYIEANGRALYVPGGVRLEAGRTLVVPRCGAAPPGAAPRRPPYRYPST